MDPQRPIPPEAPARDSNNSLYFILAAVIAVLAVIVWFVSAPRDTAATAPAESATAPAATSAP